MSKYIRILVASFSIFISFFLSYSLVLAEDKDIEFIENTTNKNNSFDEEPDVSAESAILIESNSKMIIFSKNEKKERAIASTTKIMTALLTIEAANREDKQVEITNKMIPVEGSSMHLKIGDILPLSSLAKGMLTVSGNDAAHSAAIAISGDIPSFAKLMNKRAKEFGMNNTHFVTPSGLDAVDEGGIHRSSAYDMALLGVAAIENNSFREISSKKSSKVTFTNPSKKLNFRNENKLLRFCEGCIGIKTGFTKLAGRCLVSAAERNDIKLVAVTLRAGDDWNDHQKLFDYGFSKLEKVSLQNIGKIEIPVVGGKISEVGLTCNENMKAAVKKKEGSLIKMYLEIPKFIYAPVEKGQIIGKAVYKINDTIISEQNVLTSCAVKEDSFGKFLGIF